MTSTKCQLVRLLELDWMIRDSRYPNASSFARQYGVTSKTVQRDIAYLRDYLNAPIQYDPVRNGYFYERDWALPFLLLAGGVHAAKQALASAPDPEAAGKVWEELRRLLLAAHGDRQEDGFVPYELRFAREWVYSDAA